MSQLVLTKLQEYLRDGVLSTHAHCGDETALIKSDLLRATMQWLKETPELDFNMLVDLTAVDYYNEGRTPRFELVYHLYSLKHRHRIRIKLGIDEGNTAADTISDLWANADWLEREVWDMYGIRFHHHPNMKRILMYESFTGHPLRKDFPKDGRQPLVRRAADDIAQALSRRPSAQPGRDLLK